MTHLLANENELYIEHGGPIYRLMQRMGLIRGEGPSAARRALLLLAITWFPLLILSVLAGKALAPTPRESFLLDFATYARFFLVVPILIFAEVVIGPRLALAGRQFIQGGFVRSEDFPAFDRAVARLARMRESMWVEILIFGVALAAPWTLSTETIYGLRRTTWYTTFGPDGVHHSLPGLWYLYVAVPILQFLWYRWLWRLIIWTRFLGAVSRLNLDLVPTHADHAGGLEFLAIAHQSLGILALAASCILSADAAFRIVYEGAVLDNFEIPLVALLLATELVCLGPLLLFSPIMIRRKRAAQHEFSALVVRYNRAFHQKWIEGKAPEGETMLGSPDIQSFADLGTGFDFVQSMKIVPFSVRVGIEPAVLAALPALPIVPLLLPWSHIIKFIAGVVF